MGSMDRTSMPFMGRRTSKSENSRPRADHDPGQTGQQEHEPEQDRLSGLHACPPNMTRCGDNSSTSGGGRISARRALPDPRAVDGTTRPRSSSSLEARIAGHAEIRIGLTQAGQHRVLGHGSIPRVGSETKADEPSTRGRCILSADCPDSCPTG